MMILGKSLKVILLSLGVVAVVAGVVVFRDAYALSLGTGAQVSVYNSPSPTPILWTYIDKIAEAKKLLTGLTLKVGTKDISFTEDRISATSVTKKTLKDPQREIALAILNTDSGEISVVIITKNGGDIIVPSGWSIGITPRASGVRWNYWNTAYHVDASPSGPGHFVVIENLYPDEKNKTVIQKINGKKVSVVQQTINYIMYSPYSPDLHTGELVQAGQKYLHDMVNQAMTELQTKNVPSASIIGSVYDVWKDKAAYFGRIPLLEQSDFTEFLFDPQTTTERIYTIIGANGDGAFASTCNSSSACGWVQFTPGTYNMIVKAYPAAGLIKDFLTGAADHKNSIKAAILLYDHNLKNLMASNGSKVLNDPKLEEYLAASYNGSPNRANKSLTASILNAVEDWIDALTSKKGGLATETRGYLVKLRYFQTHSS